MTTARILSLLGMKKLLLHAGALAVSAEAKEAFRDELEKFAYKLGRNALELTKHAGRVTVRKEDIILAARQ